MEFQCLTQLGYNFDIQMMPTEITHDADLIVIRSNDKWSNYL